MKKRTEIPFVITLEVYWAKAADVLPGRKNEASVIAPDELRYAYVTGMDQLQEVGFVGR